MPTQAMQNSNLTNHTDKAFCEQISHLSCRQVVVSLLFAICAFFCFLSSPVSAATKKRAAAPWFEIEVVLFSYSRSPSNVQERFPLGASPLPVGRKIDLLTPYHYQDIKDLRALLPVCANQRTFGKYYQTTPSSSRRSKSQPLAQLPPFEFYYEPQLTDNLPATVPAAVFLADPTAAPLADPSVDPTAKSTDLVAQNITLDSVAESKITQPSANNTNAFSTESDAPTQSELEENSAQLTDDLVNELTESLAPQPTPESFASTGRIDFFDIQKELSQLYRTVYSSAFNTQDNEETSVENTSESSVSRSSLNFPSEPEYWQANWREIQAIESKRQKTLLNLKCNHYPKDVFDLFGSEPSVNDYQYTELPRFLHASTLRNEQRPHLLTRDELKLNDVYDALRKQPDVRPILHTGWRQRGYQEYSAIPVRLYAGVRYNKQFDEQSLARIVPPWKDVTETFADVELSPASTAEVEGTESVQNNIQKLLLQLSTATTSTKDDDINVQQALPATWKTNNSLWEIDGLFKIFMRGRYLNFDANFNVRRPGVLPTTIRDAVKNSVSAEHWAELQKLDGNKQYLYNYQFSQKRRVITTEIHYFDHPFMGIVVQARRWGW